jgi:Flp pilus assembly pilin Flp
MWRRNLKLVFRVRWLMKRADGQDLVEYAFLLAVIAGVAIASSGSVAGVITLTFNEIASGFTNAV